MAVRPEVITELLDRAFPGAQLQLKDTVGDQDHYELVITSEKFNGLTRVMQHKLVMEALGGIVGTTLHALSIKSYPKL